MNASTLQALRRLLFFSRQEAALLVAASADRPTGVSDRAWRMWEDGDRPIPADVEERILLLSDWRLTAIKTALDVINSAPGDAHIAPIWYDSLDDWISLPNREADLWRPQQSVIATLISLHPDRINPVPFDGPAYAEWLQNRKDSETMRGVWATHKNHGASNNAK